MASSSSVAGASSEGKMAAEDKRPHVLIVDEDATTRTILKLIFEKHSCTVSTAETGLQALRLLGLDDDPQRSGNDPIPKVNLVITDYYLQGDMNGYELLMKIKESSATKDVLAVLVCIEFYSKPLLAEKCIEAGVAMLAVMPLREANVVALIKKAMT